MTTNLTDPANRLTAEQLVTLQLRIMSALSFYQQRPEKEAKRMAELLTLAGAAASELQERRKTIIHAGWQLVPIEPTEGMIVDGFESEPDEDFSDPKVWAEYEAMSGCQQAAHRAKLCWAAMLSAAPPAPEQENI